jgi:hypothetical protein
MSKLRGIRVLNGPLFAVALAIPLFAACGDGGGDSLGGNCEAEIAVKADALEASVNALVSASADMKASLYVACARIATDLDADGAPDDSMANPTDEDLEDACNLAASAIARLRASEVRDRCVGSAELRGELQRRGRVHARYHRSALRAWTAQRSLRRRVHG